jgi:hypothetical protein
MVRVVAQAFPQARHAYIDAAVEGGKSRLTPGKTPRIAWRFSWRGEILSATRFKLPYHRNSDRSSVPRAFRAQSPYRASNAAS